MFWSIYQIYVEINIAYPPILIMVTFLFTAVNCCLLELTHPINKSHLQVDPDGSVQGNSALPQ